MKNTALVTGGAGFIGSHLAEHLLANGWTVRVLDDLSTGHVANLAAVAERIEFIQGSITDSKLVERAVAGAEVVFHLAAKVFVPESFEKPEEYEHVNVQGTAILLAAAKKAGVRRVVFSSTCAVYGDTTDLPIVETAPTNPLSPYAKNKLAAEELGRQASTCVITTHAPGGAVGTGIGGQMTENPSTLGYGEASGGRNGNPTRAAGGMAFTALRYFNVYGPRQDPRSAYSGVISRFADALKRGEQPVIYGDGSQTRDFIHVSDVARANLLAAKQTGPTFAIYNVGTGRETSIKALYELITRAQILRRSPQCQPTRAGDLMRSVASIALIKNDLGFAVGTLMDDGVTDLLKGNFFAS